MKVTSGTSAFPSLTAVAPATPGETPAIAKPGASVVAAGAPEPAHPERDLLRREDMERAVGIVKETVRIFDRDLEFEVTDNNRLVIRVLDATTRKVIREIPPEELIKALERMEEALGLFLDRKV